MTIPVGDLGGGQAGQAPPVGGAQSVSGQAKSMPAVGRVAVGTLTQLVPDGQEFKTGDFVMLSTDAEKDNAPIWRYVPPAHTLTEIGWVLFL